MDTHVDADISLTEHERGALARPLIRCPACGSDTLDPVVEGDAVHFLCVGCGRCWHVELGYVHRVPPATCIGCPARERCEQVWASDHAEALG